MSRWTAAAAGAVAGCLLIAGCGGGSPAISAGAGNTLRADVLALTQAAAAHQWSTADGALAQLRSDLTAAVSVDGVSAERAQAIRADIATIAADLAAHRAAVTPSTPTSSSPKPAPKPPPEPPTPHHGHGHGGDNGQGNGHGHGGGEGD